MAHTRDRLIRLGPGPAATAIAMWIALVLSAASLHAQGDSVTVIAGERYESGGIERFFLGSDYRDLWTAPIRVPVLSPDTFAGGLTLLQEGGGRQTLSLRFGDEDGREYVFRSVDKDQARGLHPDLQHTLVGYVVQDQVSSKHPGSAMVVAPLLATVEILHATPTLAVMADHPILGEYRAEFAGMLGMIEERPTETEGAGPFGEYERLISTETLFERLEESPEDRVDARAYLAVRLIDLMMGDWDRHEDQWRWAQVDRDGGRYWLPIPRDRDNAFSSVDGLIGRVGGAVRPFIMAFGEKYTNLDGLTYNARALDRRILPELPREVWDSTAAELRRRLTDEAIARAVAELPPRYLELNGADLERKLRMRRDSLPAVARDFYAMSASEVDIFATDEAERVDVERMPDGALAVRMATEEQGSYFERVFLAAETREVRLHLHGGEDSTVVRGAGQGTMMVRALGGGGDDHFADSAEGSGGRTIFYDDGEDNTFVTGPRTRIDTRPFELPEADTLIQNNQPPPRDWGTTSSLLSPSGEWRSEIGPVLGVGPKWNRFGFRRLPHARQTSISIQAAPFHARFGILAEHERIRTGGGGESRFVASASQLSLTRFHGYGNETPEGADPDLNRVWATEYSLSAELVERLSEGATARVGPVVTHLDPAPYLGSPAAIDSPAGSRSFTLGGIQAAGTYDGRDAEGFPRRGIQLTTTAEWYPLVDGDVVSSFVRSGATAAAYLPVPFPLESVLALRGGGETVWGEAPFQYAPSIGGGSSLRGYRTDRFTGDASLFASAELRSVLGRVNLLLVAGDIGTIALFDVGRVYQTGESSDLWHTSYGGGVWFGPVDRKYSAHLLVAHGEGTRLRAGLGLPF